MVRGIRSALEKRLKFIWFPLDFSTRTRIAITIRQLSVSQFGIQILELDVVVCLRRAQVRVEGVRGGKVHPLNGHINLLAPGGHTVLRPPNLRLLQTNEIVIIFFM